MTITTDKFLRPFRLGPTTLPNQVVMAALTRNRGGAGGAKGYTDYPLGAQAAT